MTLKNCVPNSTLAGSSMKKVISCGANVRNRMVQQIVKDNLSVRQTETLVKKALEGSQNRKTKVKITLSDAVRTAQSTIAKRLGTKVNIKKDISGKGHIQIPFESDEELKKILDLLQ